MIVREHKLIELGFQRKIYEKQQLPNTFFYIENNGVAFEISEDYTVAQWCNLKDVFNTFDFECYDLKNPREEAEFIDIVLEKCRIDIEN